MHKRSTDPSVDINAIDFLADAQEAALLRIQANLTHPDDLNNKLQSLRKKVLMERASIEAQLKTVMEKQLDSTQKGMDAISSAKVQCGEIHALLRNMDTMCADTDGNVKNYAFVQKVSRVHHNFSVTKELVEKFHSIGVKTQRISKLLDEDAKNTAGPANNLLLVHYELQNLVLFRTKILNDAKGSSTDVLNTLNLMFKKLEQLEYKFETFFWECCRNTWTLVQNGYFSTVVRLIKIIEVSEKADSLNQRSIDQQEDPLDNIGMKIKNYRIKYFDLLQEKVNQEIKQIIQDNGSALQDVLTGFDAIIETLQIVYTTFTPLFPKHYNIFNFFVLEYHRGIYNTIKELANADVDPSAILILTKWIQDYHDKMSSKFDVSEDLLEPRLLDGREEEFIAAYVRLVRGKLSEWLHNIISSETVEFLNRKMPPECDGSGHYIMTGSVIAFQMFNQQLDMVQSTKGHLITDIVTECCNAMTEFQVAWNKVIDLEFSKFENKSTDLNEGLVEYSMALCNDSYRSQEFAEEIINRLETVHNESKEQIIGNVKNVIEGFASIQNKCVKVLTDIVMTDIIPGMRVLHCSQWYEQDVMKLIIGTFEDYCSDFDKYMPEFLSNKMKSQLMDRFVIAYVESFINKNAKFKFPSAGERIRQDHLKLTEYFSKSKSAKRVQAAFEIVDKILALIEVNPRMIFFDFYTTWKLYPDMPMEFLERLLLRRDDMDKGSVRETIETCKTKTEAEKPDLSITTIFSKITIAG